MLQACLNGARRAADGPGVPLTPEALAGDAASAVAAGAACLHVHPRDASGAETLAPEPVGAALSAIRAAAPGVAVGVGTGAWIAPGGLERHAGMRAWRVLPDYASVNLREADAPEVITLMRAAGVPVEAGLWGAADAERFLAEIAPDACLRVLVEMQDVPGKDALAEADRVLALLAEAGSTLPVLLHGKGRSTWPCLARAAALGLDTRIGLEDTLEMPDGAPAPGNAALIEAARRIIAAP